MPKWMTAAFALFLCLQVFSTKGETVDDVINRYIHAMGGRDKLFSVNTIYREGLMEAGNGDKIAVLTHEVQDKLVRKEIVSGLDTELVAISGVGQQIPNSLKRNSLRALPTQSLSNWHTFLDLEPLLDYSVKGYTAELLGKEKLNGADCYKIKLVMKPGLEVDYFIDSQTSLVSREIYKGRNNGLAKEHDTVIEYSNYHQTRDGYIFAFQEKVNEIIRVRYTNIEVNKPTDSRLYKSQN